MQEELKEKTTAGKTRVLTKHAIYIAHFVVRIHILLRSTAAVRVKNVQGIDRNHPTLTSFPWMRYDALIQIPRACLQRSARDYKIVDLANQELVQLHRLL